MTTTPTPTHNQPKPALREEISKILVKWSMPARQAAISEIVELIRTLIAQREKAVAEDKERLDFLDRLNIALNEKYGTDYGWELVVTHLVNRLMSGDINRINLNDAKAHGFKSCREAIDNFKSKYDKAK